MGGNTVGTTNSMVLRKHTNCTSKDAPSNHLAAFRYDGDACRVGGGETWSLSFVAVLVWHITNVFGVAYRGLTLCDVFGEVETWVLVAHSVRAILGVFWWEVVWRYVMGLGGDIRPV